MGVKERIAGAEARLRLLSPGLRVVEIEGGLSDLRGDLATFGDQIVEREADETIEDFQRRARALATVSGSRLVVFGGLSPMPMDDASSDARNKDQMTDQ